MDLSNTTLVEGDEGVIVFDTLLSAETGAAALALYRKHRGDRPVKAVVYTHSHVDHFGGVKGFVSQEEVDAGEVRIFAPEGFIEHAVSENVYAGTAMGRRAAYMYGAALARGPQGQVGAGLGQTMSTGTVTLIRPDRHRHHDRPRGDRRRGPDGLPDGARHRGAVGDADLPARLQGAVRGRGRHPQPAQPADPARRRGARPARLVELPDRDHRPVRRRGRGRLRLPPLADLGQRPGRRVPHQSSATCTPTCTTRPCGCSTRAWSARRSPRRSCCRRRSRAPGAPAATTARSATTSRRSTSATSAGSTATRPTCGSTRRSRKPSATSTSWAAPTPSSTRRGPRSTPATTGGPPRSLNHVVFAQPDHAAARDLLADTYEQLGYGSENGTWRDFYLSGATELRDGQFGTPTETDRARCDRPAHPRDAVRRHRHPGQRPTGMGREAQHRRRAHRRRRAVPAAARQRRAHLQPAAAAGRRRRDPDHHRAARCPPWRWAASPPTASPRPASSSAATPSVLAASPRCSTRATRTSPSSRPDPPATTLGRSACLLMPSSLPSDQTVIGTSPSASGLAPRARQRARRGSAGRCPA